MALPLLGLFSKIGIGKILMGVAAAVIVSYGAFLFIQNKNLKLENTHLERDTLVLEETLDQTNKRYQSILDSLKEENERRIAAEREVAEIKERILNAPEEDNGDIAPVMHDTLNWLRGRKTDRD